MRKSALVRASALATLTLGALALQALAATPTDTGSTATPHYGTWGFDEKGRDTAVKPGDDFYAYANGTYLKTTEIPPDRVRFGNFDVLSVLSENRVHAILEEAAAHSGASPADRKIGAYYTAFMDEARVEQLGTKPLQGDLNRIKAAPDRAALAAIMGASTSRFGTSLFGVRIGPDAKDPSRYAVNLGQAGLGLPDRDYYLKPDLAAKKAAYQAYVAKMLQLIGWPDADAQAKADRRAGDPRRRGELDAAAAPRPRQDLQRDERGRAGPGPPRASTSTASCRAPNSAGSTRVVVAENTAVPKLAGIYGATSARRP